jgi:hypothetical protein
MKKILEQTEIIVDGEVVNLNILDDDDDMDTLINEIVAETTAIDKITNDTVVTEPVAAPVANGIDLDEKHSLANRIVENSLDVIKNSKMVFSSFSDDVIHGKDRSTSSKEVLIKALEVQNQANKNLIDLARSLEGDKGGNTNILITSSISPKKSGINPDNIKSHFSKD